MNDFTKEETKLLLNCLYYCSPYGEDSLKDKLQSMIDSYCEHTYVARTAPHAHGAKEIGAVVQCSKCGEPPRTTNE